MRVRLAAWVTLALAVPVGLVVCDDDTGTTQGVRPAPPGRPWATLAEWQLFEDAGKQVPAEGVEPFEVISPLFADYAAKHRFLWLPEGASMTYTDDGAWDLPVGAIVIKTFAYPLDMRDPAKGERLLETRLMVHEPGGWVPHTYVWDEAQTKTERKIAGVFIQASWIAADGATRNHRYVVPTTNECQECHGKAPETRLLGVKTAQMDRDNGGENQIERFARLGWFGDGAVTAAAGRMKLVPPEGDGELTLRARAYLDANCAHCHSDGGDADSKALYLDFDSTDPSEPAANWGVCKLPTSAGGATCGHVFDVVPGDADHSVMICRMESTEGSDQMPPIGRGLAHAEGVAVIRAWIDAMSADDCTN